MSKQRNWYHHRRAQSNIVARTDNILDKISSRVPVYCSKRSECGIPSLRPHSRRTSLSRIAAVEMDHGFIKSVVRYQSKKENFHRESEHCSIQVPYWTLKKSNTRRKLRWSKNETRYNFIGAFKSTPRDAIASSSSIEKKEVQPSRTPHLVVLTEGTK